MDEVGSVIVSWDFSHGKDKGILLVGKKSKNKDAEVINAFQWEEAEKIYKLLTTVKSKED